MCVCVCVCVSVCVRERALDNVCGKLCVCVCERETERGSYVEGVQGVCMCLGVCSQVYVCV